MDPLIKEKMNDRIRQVMKARTGPSFEERMAVRSAAFKKVTKATEHGQAKLIQAAVARGKAQPCVSAARPEAHVPPSIEDHGKQHAQTRRENESRYARLAAEQKHRMDTREPLFKLEEVKAAFDMQNQRILDNKKRMQDDEGERWDHLREVQERVLNRPLLMEDPCGGSSAPHDEEEAKKEKDPNWKEKFNKELTKSIQQTIKQRSGPSFEARVAVRSEKFRREAKATVLSQTRVIDAAVARAKAKPCESALRSKELTPPSIEDWAKEHASTRAENEARFAQDDAERRHRMNTREPLFRVSEVQAAFEMQAKRQIENKRRLREDEKERWAFLASMQERVIDRPLLVEKFEKDRHTKSNPDIRLIPNHAKPVAMNENIRKCVSQPWFTDSAWGKEVSSLRARMDARPKLHEIAYPPKVFPEKPCRPKMGCPLDDRLHEVISQGWYKQSEWAKQVQGIKQRQDDRIPLSEMKYPPKKYDCV